MNLSILRKIGLTDGEIKVYQALLSVGKTSSGNIMKKSGISSSKVYLILEKLVQKGLVSFVIQDNVKYFQACNPKTILEYIESQKESLQKVKDEMAEIIPQITTHYSHQEEESAKVYKGTKGLFTAYMNILDELHKGDEYCFFVVNADDIKEHNTLMHISNFHKKRIEKGVKVHAIADTEVYKIYQKDHVLGKLYSLKHHDLTFPTGFVIGKTRVLLILFGEEKLAYELISERLAERYRKLFYKIWKIAKK